MTHPNESTQNETMGYFTNTEVFGREQTANGRLTNSELRRKFAQGETGYRNHTGSMGTVELRNGDTALIGYGHAIYAERDANDGAITLHRGWIDWALGQHENAEATPRHIRNLEPLADRSTDRNPSAAAPPNEIREIGRMGMRGV